MGKLRYAHGLSESQKDAVRRDRLSMSGPLVAEKHGITRERVRQIVSEPSNEERRQTEIELGIKPYCEPPPRLFVRGPLVPMASARYRRFEDAEVQDAIRNEHRMSLSALERKYGAPRIVLERILGRNATSKTQQFHQRSLAVIEDLKTMTARAVAAKHAINQRSVWNIASRYRSGRLDKFLALRAITTAQ